jgi:hypothetical protein
MDSLEEEVLTFCSSRTVTVLTVTVPPPQPSSTNYVYVTVNQPAPYTSQWTQEQTVTGEEEFHSILTRKAIGVRSLQK